MKGKIVIDIKKYIFQRDFKVPRDNQLFFYFRLNSTMNSAVKLSSSFYRYVRGSSSNIYKLSNNYTPKCLLNCKYGIQLCDNWRCVSSATDINEPHSTKNSPSWKLKDDKSFNKGTVIAGIATAVCISAVIYHKFHKGVKAETGKKSHKIFTNLLR